MTGAGRHFVFLFGGVERGRRLGRGDFLARHNLVIWFSITEPVYGRGRAFQVPVGEVDDVERTPDSVGRGPCQARMGDVGDVERSLDSVGRRPCQVPVGDVERSPASVGSGPCQVHVGDVDDVGANL